MRDIKTVLFQSYLSSSLISRSFLSSSSDPPDADEAILGATHKNQITVVYEKKNISIM